MGARVYLKPPIREEPYQKPGSQIVIMSSNPPSHTSRPFIVRDYGKNPPQSWVRVKINDKKNSKTNDSLDEKQLQSLLQTLKKDSKLSPSSNPQAYHYVLRTDVQKVKCIRTIAVRRGEGENAKKVYYATSVFHRGRNSDVPDVLEIKENEESDSNFATFHFAARKRKGPQEVFKGSAHTKTCLGRLQECPVVLDVDREDYTIQELVEIVKRVCYKFGSRDGRNRKLDAKDFVTSGLVGLDKPSVSYATTTSTTPPINSTTISAIPLGAGYF